MFAILEKHYGRGKYSNIAKTFNPQHYQSDFSQQNHDEIKQWGHNIGNDI